jgi:nucleoside-diphosphate-sugar epimerase
MPTLLIFGLGYLGAAVARQAEAAGWSVRATSRDRSRGLIDPTDAGALTAALTEADALLVTAAPGSDGCPAHAAMGDLLGANRPGWLGYVSSTAVYGDRGGGWVFEDSPLNAASIAGARRVAAEALWLDEGAHIFRLPAIYGPGRSTVDRLRDGTARRVKKPGQVFNRVHVEDATSGILASISRPRPGRAYNLADDDPSSMEAVLLVAAERMGLAAPPETDLNDPSVSEAMRGFYLDSKRVSNARAKAELGWRPRYPTWREGLEALLSQP